MSRIACPACHSGLTSPTGVTISPRQAADYLIPPRRSPERNDRLVGVLTDLWGTAGARIDLCQACGFGFSNPYVAGTPEVYNSIGDGAQHYPRQRFEFGATLASLRRRDRVGRLLEVGAGSGSFQKDLLGAALAEERVATEYDRNAIASLRSIPGLAVFEGDFRDHLDALGTFDVICLFQVLEHLDDLDRTFAALARLLEPGGDVFISVPNHDRISVQETLTGLMDMPPQHIGRWTLTAMDAIAQRHGLVVREEAVSRVRALRELWGLAVYRLEARSRSRGSLMSHLERIRHRPIRGALKRVAAVWDLAALVRHYGTVPSDTRWFHLGHVGVRGHHV